MKVLPIQWEQDECSYNMSFTIAHIPVNNTAPEPVMDCRKEHVCVGLANVLTPQNWCLPVTTDTKTLSEFTSLLLRLAGHWLLCDVVISGQCHKVFGTLKGGNLPIVPVLCPLQPLWPVCRKGGQGTASDTFRNLHTNAGIPAWFFSVQGHLDRRQPLRIAHIRSSMLDSPSLLHYVLIWIWLDWHSRWFLVASNSYFEMWPSLFWSLNLWLGATTTTVS